jgi:hypothetical protein
MSRNLLNPALLRSRWAAIGAAIAVTLGTGGLAIANAATSPRPGVFHALSPERVFDTRDGTGGVPIGTIGAGGSLDVVVAGTHGVPANATSVVLNVTAVNGSTTSYLTIWPSGEARPLASSLNWTNGDARPNSVTATLGAGGKVSFFNFAGTVHVLADVAGYYTAADTPPFTNVVAQVINNAGLGGSADIASVNLTLPDVCPGAPDQWAVLVQADGYFLTSGGGAGTATIGLGTTSGVLAPGTVANQNFNSTGQWREPYSTSMVFTVDSGTVTFYEIGIGTHPVGVTAAQNNLIAQSLSVTC